MTRESTISELNSKLASLVKSNEALQAEYQSAKRVLEAKDSEIQNLRAYEEDARRLKAAEEELVRLKNQYAHELQSVEIARKNADNLGDSFASRMRELEEKEEGWNKSYKHAQMMLGLKQKEITTEKEKTRDALKRLGQKEDDLKATQVQRRGKWNLMCRQY